MFARLLLRCSAWLPRVAMMFGFWMFARWLLRYFGGVARQYICLGVC